MAHRWGQRNRGSFPTATRRRIIRRDGCCQVCGTTDNLEADHVTPVMEAMRAGWSDDDIHHEDNGQALCVVHHAEKSKAEALRGRARRRNEAKRPAEPHPGLVGRSGG